MNIPDRKEYLQHHAQKGQTIMGVLPALYPRELLWAFDILPAEIWDPPGEIMEANAHLQPSICAIVKRGLEFILKDSGLITAGYLFPHTCDSLQNLGTQVKDLLKVKGPIYSFYNPKSAYNNASRQFYLGSLKAFANTLEQVHGTLAIENLNQACERSQRIDGLRLQLRGARFKDQLDLTNLEYFQLLRAQEFMLPSDYEALLKTSLVQIKPERSGGLPIMVSGILAPRTEILDLLDAHEVSIVLDDLLAVNRRLPIAPLEVSNDPWEYLTDRFFLQPPCSTRANGLDDRIRYLETLLTGGQIKGVLFDIVKFCEPELFDQPALIKYFQSRGLASLKLETELEAQLSGQTLTRVEAFIELLKERELT